MFAALLPAPASAQNVGKLQIEVLCDGYWRESAMIKSLETLRFRWRWNEQAPSSVVAQASLSASYGEPYRGQILFQKSLRIPGVSAWSEFLISARDFPTGPPKQFAIRVQGDFGKERVSSLWVPITVSPTKPTINVGNNLCGYGGSR